METLNTKSKEQLQEELNELDTAYWDAHDAFMIARNALAAKRNELKGLRNE